MPDRKAFWKLRDVGNGKLSEELVVETTNPNTGTAMHSALESYNQALRSESLVKAQWNPHASVQPSDIEDAQLHTSVVWRCDVHILADTPVGESMKVRCYQPDCEGFILAQCGEVHDMLRKVYGSSNLEIKHMSNVAKMKAWIDHHKPQFIWTATPIVLPNGENGYQWWCMDHSPDDEFPY